MHGTSGRWKLGLILALTTALCWGVLPVALTLLLRGLDPYTITWCRFTVASILLGAILAFGKGLPNARRIQARTWLLLGLALFGLAGNYVIFLFALTHTSPSVAQTLGQLSSAFLLLGGVLIYKERFSGIQWLGFAVLICGMLLFFNRRLPEIYHVTRGLGLGVMIAITATLVWTVYGLTQKRLLRELPAPQVLLLLYIGAAIALIPAASPTHVSHLTGLQFGMLAFSCLNTVVAYGAFAEALHHWDVSRVGAVLATTPLFTMTTMQLVGHLAPGLVPAEHLNALSVLGALLVVLGSATCALANRVRPAIRIQPAPAT